MCLIFCRARSLVPAAHFLFVCVGVVLTVCIFFLHICAHLWMFVISFCSVCILFPVSMTGEHFMFAAGCSFGLSSKD